MPPTDRDETLAADSATIRTAPAAAVTTSAGEDRAVLDVRAVSRHYRPRGRRRSAGGAVRAVDDVSLRLGAGEALGIVGESGCGKSTLARLLVRLETPTAGQVLFEGRDVHRAKGAELTALRRSVQIVFQDPYTSLNPRMTIGDIVGEGLDLHAHAPTGAARRRRIAELLELVGLATDHLDRYPHQFSGGQRQRVGIARALAPEPSVLVLDEPVSALDVSIQAQVINLLQDLRETLGLSYILISHDLSVVGQTCDRVGVMYLGKLVEIGPAEQIFSRATHPYTQALLSTVPRADFGVRDRRQRIVLRGELPDPADPPSGCNFRTRCFQAAEVCAERTPPLRTVAPGLVSACHFASAADETAGAVG